MKLRLFEMFAGFGGASFALKKAGIPFEVVGYSEIDKFAIKCYEQNHFVDETILSRSNTSIQRTRIIPKNYGDCTKINPDDLPDFDLLTGGFPCQSFSVAGKGLGEQDTRGTLFHEIIRIAEVKKPKFMLLENVKGLLSKRHKATFDKILSELDRIGYQVEWEVLNSKDYGIPQNRERVFFVCFRKDLGKRIFYFPEKEELKIFLKDILEEDVDEKYYLSDKRINLLINGKRFGSTNKITPLNGITQCLSASMGCGGGYEPKIVQVNKPKHSNNRVYSEEGISPTLNTMNGGNRQPFIKVNHSIMGSNLSRYSMKYPRNPYNKDNRVSWCVSTKPDNGVSTNGVNIRKLTPTECFRLMGFLNDEINLEGLSNTQKYKLAGNGWDINLVSKIFKQMFKGE